MEKAGKAVDDLIEQLLPHLEDGDILIDGGNSHFPDTIRRVKKVEETGKLYNRHRRVRRGRRRADRAFDYAWRSRRPAACQTDSSGDCREKWKTETPLL